MQAYIIKTHYSPKQDAIKLQIITESPLQFYKDVAKIVQLLNKERTKAKYHLIYAESKRQALNKAQERI